MIFLAAFAASSAAMGDQPTSEMMAPVQKVADYIATADSSDLSAFASHDVVIVENFPPYVFDGPDAVKQWAKGMRSHTGSCGEFVHRFGPAQDFSTSGDRVYFSLPTHWTWSCDAKAFAEDGGWSFVLVRQKGEWRVVGYGWSVINFDSLP
jgi:hypothetical protein